LVCETDRIPDRGDSCNVAGTAREDQLKDDLAQIRIWIAGSLLERFLEKIKQRVS
jgi:hypothetical protein